MQSSRYYSSIDGLRAIAVLSVFIYHLNETALRGGYFGVDIFFVISGFVVTGSVAGRNFNSLFDFQQFFYTRRILRIVPALVVCLLVTTIATILFIPSSWLSSSTSETGLAAFFGVSNIVLAFNNDEYFSPRAGFNPFVHTWSLGVEEQFYFLFPFVIYFFLKNKRTDSLRTTKIMATICVVSFAICGLLTPFRWEYAFYLPVSRIWEIGVGVYLYLTMERWKPALGRLPAKTATMVSATALLGILGSFLVPASLFSPFPLALLPVAAVSLLIATSVSCPSNIVAGRLLSNPGFVAIGKLSYSLYLWHWPVFVLFRWTYGLDTLPKCAAAAALSILLSVLSYRLVETPMRHFRFEALLSRSRFLLTALGLIVVCAGSSAVLFKYRSAMTLSVTGRTAEWYPVDKPSGNQAVCRMAKSTRTDAGVNITSYSPQGCQGERSASTLHVAGDSHANAYVPLLIRYGMETNAEVKLYANAGCAFVPLYRPVSRLSEPCQRSHRHIAALLSATVQPQDVVFLPSLRLPRFQDQWGGVDENGRRSSSAGEDKQERQAIIAEAEATLKPILARGARIEIEAPKPIFKTPPFRCADWFNDQNPICKAGFSVSREELEALRRPVVSIMEVLARDNPALSIWDPFRQLCPSDVCHSFRGDKPLYFDADHLSGFGNDVLYADFRRHTDALVKNGATASLQR